MKIGKLEKIGSDSFSMIVLSNEMPKTVSRKEKHLCTVRV